MWGGRGSVEEVSGGGALHTSIPGGGGRSVGRRWSVDTEEVCGQTEVGTFSPIVPEATTSIGLKDRLALSMVCKEVRNFPPLLPARKCLE